MNVSDTHWELHASKACIYQKIAIIRILFAFLAKSFSTLLAYSQWDDEPASTLIFYPLLELFTFVISEQTKESRVEEIPSGKTKRVKGSSKKWFDSVVAEGITSIGKLLKKFKKAVHIVDWEIFM